MVRTVMIAMKNVSWNHDAPTAAIMKVNNDETLGYCSKNM